VKCGAEEGYWNDHVKNEVISRVKEDRNILHTVKKGRLT
jgi:hypothetical protein